MPADCELSAEMISIDQNCHSLWDALPKLHALAGAAEACSTASRTWTWPSPRSARVGFAATCSCERERFHRSGGQDWGAAMFYSRVPGPAAGGDPRLGAADRHEHRPLWPTSWAGPWTSCTTSIRPADNWQLIGPSYVGDARHHRVIGDLERPRRPITSAR